MLLNIPNGIDESEMTPVVTTTTEPTTTPEITTAAEPITNPATTTTPESTRDVTTSESETHTTAVATTDSQIVSAVADVTKVETKKATVAASSSEKQVVEITDSNGQNLTQRDFDSYFYNGDDISFAVLQDTLTANGIDYILVNNFDMIGSSMDWQLQKKINGQWYNLNYIDGNLDEYLDECLLPVGTKTGTYNFGKYFGSLEAGEYRVIFFCQDRA